MAGFPRSVPFKRRTLPPPTSLAANPQSLQTAAREGLYSRNHRCYPLTMDFNSLVVRLALLLSIPGCGRPPAHYPGFEVYVDTFLREGASRGKTVDLWGVNIALVDTISAPMSPLTVGVCDPSENKIEILRSFWETYPQYHEQLVFHELGHCLLAKPHIACPSIMCEYLISNTIYDDNRSQLLDVLFAN